MSFEIHNLDALPGAMMLQEGEPGHIGQALAGRDVPSGTCGAAPA